MKISDRVDFSPKGFLMPHQISTFFHLAKSLGKLSSPIKKLKTVPRNLLFDTRLRTEGNKYKTSSLDCPSNLHEER
ncbi:hypothetical protein HNY73_008157 [Argiope bruennichi]|uniref:Uncharacterized protein n=1 Tax=Argiope bruennichi TaxID=94029 RepID=A0A8T0F7S3_ARGBR|nr:hypothetical protein HNY73_008157 [Argiope bruennichi]